MDEVLTRLAQKFLQVARREEELLASVCGEGIFYVPELAFAYLCGLEAMKDRAALFGTEDVKWRRETILGADGPTDLAFELGDGRIIAVEFKMRDNGHKYLADVRKLERLPSGVAGRMFVALIDAFDEPIADGRATRINECGCATPLLGQEGKTGFTTSQHWYSREVRCFVCAWSIRAAR